MPNEDKRFHNMWADYLEGNYHKVAKIGPGLDKRAYRTWALTGKAHLRLGNFQEAVKSFEMSNKINKNNALALEGLGDIEFMQGRYLQAVEHYRRAFSQDNKNAGLALKLAFAYKNLKDDKNAQRFAQIVRRLDVNPFVEEHEIATLMAGAERKKLLEKSLGGSVFFEKSWHGLIEMALEEGNTGSAQNILYITSFSDKADFMHFYNLALVHSRLGEEQEAISNLRYALNLNPDFEDADKLLEKLLGTVDVL
jgi:tetratricopeptide (TPR) repeat protein